MTHLPETLRIAMRIRQGSALERMIRTSQHKTVSGAVHEMAAKLEAVSEVTGVPRDISAAASDTVARTLKRRDF